MIVLVIAICGYCIYRYVVGNVNLIHKNSVIEKSCAFTADIICTYLTDRAPGYQRDLIHYYYYNHDLPNRSTISVVTLYKCGPVIP